MSFGFLPAPVYIAMTILIIIALFKYSLEYYKAKDKALGLGFSLFGIGTFHITTAKIIEEYFRNYEHYVWILAILAIVIMFVGFTVMIIGKWEYAMRDPQRKKHLIASFIIIGVGISLMVIAATIY